MHKDVYDWFNIKFDYFGKTSTNKQTEITHEIFNSLYKNNFTEIRTIKQLYCDNCNKFLADRYVEGQCPLCNSKGARGDQCDSCNQL